MNTLIFAIFLLTTTSTASNKCPDGYVGSGHIRQCLTDIKAEMNLCGLRKGTPTIIKKHHKCWAGEGYFYVVRCEVKKNMEAYLHHRFLFPTHDSSR